MIPAFYEVRIFILCILFCLILFRFDFLFGFDCFILGLRELSSELALKRRPEDSFEASRGHIWWAMISRFCRFPWKVLYELSTKARGEF